MNAIPFAWFLLALSGFGGAGMAQSPAGTVLWSYDESVSLSAPTLGQDGTVYVGSSAAVFAITNAGGVASNKWSFPVGSQGSAAISPDGTVLFGGQDGVLYALSPDGSSKWAFQAQGGAGSPAVGADGTIYFAGWGTLYAISPSGSKRWTFDLPSGLGFPLRSPSIAPDGTIYVGSAYTSQLFAINPDGSQKWVYNFAHRISDAAAIGGDGTVYTCSQELYATSPFGTNLWATSGADFDGSPAIGPDGTIYVGGAQSHYLTAIGPGAQFQWAVLPQPSVAASTTPAIDRSGNIYYCVSNGVWAVSKQGLILWNVTAPGDPGPGAFFATTSPLVGPDGTVYASLGTKLYAIASATTNAPNGPWPMDHQNSRHTGKVERPSLKQPQKRADRNFEFQLFPEQLGLTYTIEMSTNLNTWTSLTSIVANTLPTDIADLTATNAPLRFYRVFSP